MRRYKHLQALDLNQQSLNLRVGVLYGERIRAGKLAADERMPKRKTTGSFIPAHVSFFPTVSPRIRAFAGKELR